MKNTVDLKDLREQRNTLNILLAYPEQYNLSKERTEHLTGIQNLLDYINDNLEDWKVCTLVPKEKEAEPYKYYKHRKTKQYLRIINKAVQSGPVAFLGEYTRLPNSLVRITLHDLEKDFYKTTEEEYYKHKKD